MREIRPSGSMRGRRKRLALPPRACALLYGVPIQKKPPSELQHHCYPAAQFAVSPMLRYQRPDGDSLQGLVATHFSSEAAIFLVWDRFGNTTGSSTSQISSWLMKLIRAAGPADGSFACSKTSGETYPSAECRRCRL